MREVYLDNSATTMVCRESEKEIIKLLTKKYGNPSSLHSKGLEAEKEIRESKNIISKMVGCDSGEIYFTSGGTESNNLAIFGSIKSKGKYGNKIVTTSIEHSSVIESMQELEKQGYNVVYLEPGDDGKISRSQIFEAVTPDTILISIMMVNNEIGTIQPVDDIKKIVALKKSPALIHVDAVQAFGKIPVKVNKIGADLISITAHKLHGPKGVGALYVSKKARILPIMFGGEQQKKLRPGTEPSALIAGFGAAVGCLPDMTKEYESIMELRNYCANRLSKIDIIKINSPESALPYILNFSVEGIRSETMLHYLASNEIYVSSGSACAKGKKSHVLKALGLSDRRVDSAIRVSFSRYNTMEDVDILIDSLKKGIKTLVKSRGN